MASVRVNLTLDEGDYGLYKLASEMTGLPVAAIINRFLSAHCEELVNWLDWMGSMPKDDRLREYGANLLISYGPRDLITEIKRVQPGFKTLGERLLEGSEGAKRVGELADSEKGGKQ